LQFVDGAATISLYAADGAPEGVRSKIERVGCYITVAIGRKIHEKRRFWTNFRLSEKFLGFKRLWHLLRLWFHIGRQAYDGTAKLLVKKVLLRTKRGWFPLTLPPAGGPQAAMSDF
jgi:hypothetical protein